MRSCLASAVLLPTAHYAFHVSLVILPNSGWDYKPSTIWILPKTVSANGWTVKCVRWQWPARNGTPRCFVHQRADIIVRVNTYLPFLQLRPKFRSLWLAQV